MQSADLLVAMSLILVAACGGKPARPAQPAQPTETTPAHHGHHRGHHGFTDAEQWATVFDAPDRDGWQKPDEVVALLAPGPGQTVVDVGAGTGYFAGRLSRAVGASGQVIATDVEASMVTYMTDRAAREHWDNVVAKLTPPEDPQLAAASVDRILVVDVWHHLPDAAAYTRLLAAGLRPGGMIAVVDFTQESPMGPPAEMRVTAEAVAEVMTAAGLVTEIAPETLPHQYVVLGRKRP